MLQPTGHWVQMDELRCHFPGAGAKAEIGRGQRAYRADIGGVAGKDRVKTRLGIGDDLQCASAVVETDAPGHRQSGR